ncbi:MAG: PorP/SprF family type IX secretion system membrane protein [Saprospiraceae bacterium]|nr:PorP/SprF family type IX secretion system membrane protein [Bacteroidia bacterium]NNE15805.1 PorP/SprF family type IX secretion system membrane protein [Saprospiraceae bacterium]NNL92243.1 PorP/SprF family type IX secretion system membrane protein [Saprospiraceae bacterium]
MKKLLYIFVLIGFVSVLKAQQLPFTTPTQDLAHFWNPAFTAPGTDMMYTGFFRKQWVGFDNAPNTAFVSLQYPFVDMNMSAGAAIVSDKTGPVSKLGLQLNYAYKLKEVLKDDDHLALGVSGYFYQYRFNPNGELVNQSGDPLFGMQTESKFNPSVGLGFAYFSSTKEFARENIFYFGMSTMQFLSGKLLLESGDAQRVRHYFGNIGLKFFNYDSYIEPSIQLSFVNPELIDIVVGMKYEMEETFWAGLNYSTISDLSFSGGVIMKDVGGRYTSLRLGILAAFNAGDLLQAGPSLEFFAAYRFDVD